MTPDATPPHLRPSLAELSRGDGPRECPHCGCRDYRVVSTWRNNDGTVRRRRVCRHCGQDEFISSERPE